MSIKNTDLIKNIVVLLPCHNETASIRKTVEDFRSILPEAVIYVYDNLSIDNTSEEALKGGAIVRSEQRLGKGNVVKRMFADVDADIYLMADGDGTYDYKSARLMIQVLINQNLDMVIGTRINVYKSAHRIFHGFGNQFFNNFYRVVFDQSFTDIFSGYRVFSRRFVKSFPAISTGFEIEAEMSVHASQLRLPIAEIPTSYGSRMEGTESKLRTVRDGFRILFMLLILLKEIRPLQFFGTIASLMFLIFMILFIPIFSTYLETGLVPRIPSLILSVGILMVGVVFLQSGLILDSVARGRLEQKRMSYLKI